MGPRPYPPLADVDRQGFGAESGAAVLQSVTQQSVAHLTRVGDCVDLAREALEVFGDVRSYPAPAVVGDIAPGSVVDTGMGPYHQRVVVRLMRAGRRVEAVYAELRGRWRGEVADGPFELVLHALDVCCCGMAAVGPVPA